MPLSSICYALGYGTGLAAFWWMARRRGLDTPGVMTILLAGLLGALVCANVLQWVCSGSPGKTILGGVAGGYLSVIAVKSYLGIRRPLGDLFAVAASAGEAVGRWGCYYGGCCYGRPSHVPWAIWQYGCFRHPTQLYLSAGSALILCLLLWLDRSHQPENMLFFEQGLLFCLLRFVVEHFRAHDGLTLGLSLAQWACAAGAIFFAFKIRQLSNHHREPAVTLKLEAEFAPSSVRS